MRPNPSEAAQPVPEDSRSRLRRLLRERMGSTGGWFPLSHGQEALWFLWKLAPESPAYTIVLPFGIRGALDPAELRCALQILSDRHPGLRTAFREDNGQTRQIALPQHRLLWEEIDASAWSRDDIDAALRLRARQPFDLETSAALRVTLLRRSAGAFVLLLAIPHIVSDLWSLIILLDELREVLATEKAGEAVRLAALPLDYEDYVRWQARMLESPAGDAHWCYWQAELGGELPTLDLPTDRLRPRSPSFRGGTIARTLDAELARRLKDLARAADATLFMTLLTAFQVLLHRLSGQDGVVVGTPTFGRQRSELAGIVGNFINMVPLRADLAGDPGFRTLLARNRTKVVGAIEHQDYPFSLLVDRLQPARDLSRSPIFQASFVLQTFHRFEDMSRGLLPAEDEASIPFGDLELEPWPLPQQEGQFDLALEMKENERGALMAAWKYAADLFEPATITQISGHFETLLRAIVAEPDRPVGRLSLLTAAEQALAIAAGRGASGAAPEQATVVELFEARIARYAQAPAVTCGARSLGYTELGTRVAVLARRLAAEGVGPDVVVALWLPRGFEFVTALLAVAKAGGAFLPLDPRHPMPRALPILARCGAPLVLTTAALEPGLGSALDAAPAPGRPRLMAIDTLETGTGPSVPLPRPRARDLAYVMYTSGSTGEPKGVMVEHRGMVNHVLAKLSDLGIGPGDALAQNAPQSFDVVVWQTLAPLVTGARVVIIPDAIAESAAALMAEVRLRGVTVLQLVPAMAHAVLEAAALHPDGAAALAGLRWMVPTGEALPLDLCRRWFDLYPRIPVLNTYGSTECSDDQCHYRLDRLAPADRAAPIVSIGTPIPNMTAYVLDRDLALVPDGVAGELHIGGIGVGRGYRDDPARTAACFVPDPFGREPGARLYKTRDLARRRADGAIDFLGRVDHMIKLRGLRIEPGEIEAGLLRHPDVAEAAVVARAHPSGERRLVAYVVPARRGGAGAPEIEDLRRFLAAQLPLFMVPAGFRLLEAMPLTGNGKLDQRRLPAPDWQAEIEAYVAPRTPAEAKMAALWAEVLGLDRVGIDQDFFALGGDSILSIKIAARCWRAGLPITPGDLFQDRTVAALVARLDQAAPAAETAVPRMWAPLVPPPVDPAHLERAVAGVTFDEG